MNILFVGRVFGSKLDGGGYVTKRNLELLKKIADVDEFLVDLKNTPKDKLINALFLKSYNYKNTIDLFRKKITNKFYDVVFFDGSLFGSFSYEVKTTSPKSKVYTFLHNVEYIYYKKMSKGLMGLVWSNYISYIEKKALTFSDYIFSLNQRDAAFINELYGLKIHGILPISFPSISNSVKNRPNIKQTGKLKLLFVGSAFYANIEGISWFLEHVIPFVDVELVIAGKGMDDIFSSKENVKVMGYVDNLSDLYSHSDVVIAPIFSGSGMKTKTAEALREGKMIVATSEALCGYDVKGLTSVKLCDSSMEFINWLKKLNEDGVYSWYECSLNLFENKYSDHVVLQLLKSFFPQNISMDKNKLNVIK